MESKYGWTTDLIGQALGHMYQYMKDGLEAYNDKIEGLEGQDGAVTQYAWALDPEPINGDLLAKRAPYANPAGYVKAMADASERGWLNATDNGVYGQTEKGFAYADGLVDAVAGTLDVAPALANAEMQTLKDLLEKVIAAASKLDEPKNKYAAWLGGLFERENAPQAYHMRRAFIKLLSVRDDSHVAAWSAQGIGGQALETLSFVWGEKAQTAEKLNEALGHRMYDAAAYQGALDELTKRGWIEKNGDLYVATEAGTAVREEIEARTNELYNAAFGTLSEEESDQLKSLLGAYADVLKKED